MARLPTPGSDSGTWGNILNDYLAQALAADGTLKANSVGSTQLMDNAVTSASIAPNTVDATIIADGSITEILLDASVQAKLNQTAGVTSVAGKTGNVTVTKSDVGLSNVDNTSDAAKNSASATIQNKTLDNSNLVTVKDSNLTLQDNTDTTKQAQFQASGISSGTTRTYTLPDSSGTLALTSLMPPVRFSAPTAVIGVTPTDYAFSPRTLTGARMRTSSAPAGSDLVAQVQHWDGFSWNTVGTLTISDGSVSESVISFSCAQTTGNMVRLNVTSVGSNSPATGVAVDVVVG